MTEASGDRSPIICGAKMNMSTASAPIMPIPRKAVIQAKLVASSLRRAPTDCPTRVVAASAMPTPGI